VTPIEKVQKDWLAHGFTCRLRKHIEEQHGIALKQLLSVCRESSDPKVTRRFADYEQIGSFLSQLGKERADGSDDGDD
jgi:hypothetical protein